MNVYGCRVVLPFIASYNHLGVLISQWFTGDGIHVAAFFAVIKLPDGRFVVS